MEESREDDRTAVTQAVGKVFGIITVVLYFILGTTFIFYTPERLATHYAIPFGVVLYAYGLFRGYKYYKKYFAR